MMISRRLSSLLLLVAAFVPATAQSLPAEITELRQRVATIRAEMTHITSAADFAADIFTRDSAARFLISGVRNAGLRSEFDWHAGASPEFRDADDPAARGILLLPILSWEISGFAASMLVERAQSAGRSVIIIGSLAGTPDSPLLRRVVPNGAPNGSREHATINEVANLVATWALYAEFVASATRHGWQPGIYVSHLVPRADDSNYKIRFHTPPGARAVTPIPAGLLGNQYLDRIDSLLTLAAKPRHQAMVARAADSLRAQRTAGRRLFAAACAYYLQTSLPGDSLASPFRAVRAQWETVQPLLARGARAGDVVLWFGYGGYDCPHVEASYPLQQAGFKVVAVSDQLPAQLPANVLAPVPLSWHLPEQIGKVAFNAEGVGSASSVEALLHYLWLRRLVGPP